MKLILVLPLINWLLFIQTIFNSLKYLLCGYKSNWFVIKGYSKMDDKKRGTTANSDRKWLLLAKIMIDIIFYMSGFFVNYYI